jgi:hypothetical protein
VPIVVVLGSSGIALYSLPIRYFGTVSSSNTFTDNPLLHPKFVPILYAALVAPIAVMTDIEMTEMTITKVFRVFVLSISAGSLLESSKTPL